jgi:hypothetical protein
MVPGVRVEISRVNLEQQTYAVISGLDSWISDEPELQQKRLASLAFSILAVLAVAPAGAGLGCLQPNLKTPRGLRVVSVEGACRRVQVVKNLETGRYSSSSLSPAEV